MEKAKRYENLDGVRVLSCFAIIIMHVQANTVYEISCGSFFYNTVITSWTQFVYLFLMISSFSMCCGYFERFRTNSMDLEIFYSRRYAKILPFFAVLIAIALVVEPSVETVYEAFIELTLVYGLLPNNELSVLGVSWTLGVIFLFYLLFPFFVYLLSSKRRAWLSFAVSCVLTYLCERYFFTEKFVVASFSYRHCFLYCAPVFLIGGLIYIYRSVIEAWILKHKWLALTVCLAETVAYYLIPDQIGGQSLLVWKLMPLFASWLCWLISVRTGLLDNKLMHFLGGISFEMYLAQMIVFRIWEKLGLLYLAGRGWFSFVISCTAIGVGLVLFVLILKQMLEKVGQWLKR